MVRLKELVASCGGTEVASYLASGNLSFHSRSSARSLEPRIERAFRDALGYEVETFLRTDDELVAAHDHPAYTAKEIAGAHTIAIGFMRSPLDKAARARVAALANGEDEFRANGREIYQRNVVGLGKSKITPRILERALGQPVTMRNIKTVARLVEVIGER
jgi:uncharacterized protein (DUF1697 family)